MVKYLFTPYRKFLKLHWFVTLQATIAPPVQGKMLKGLCVCYSVIATTYLGVGISGYWAFGNQAQGTLLSNFMDAQKSSLLPTWFVVMTNIFTLTQVLAVTLVKRTLTTRR